MTRQHPLAEPEYYSDVDFKGKNGIAGLNQLRLYADWERIFCGSFLFHPHVLNIADAIMI